jgi:hypothetical protein
VSHPATSDPRFSSIQMKGIPPVSGANNMMRMNHHYGNSSNNNMITTPNAYYGIRNGPSPSGTSQGQPGPTGNTLSNQRYEVLYNEFGEARLMQDKSALSVAASPHSTAPPLNALNMNNNNSNNMNANQYNMLNQQYPTNRGVSGPFIRGPGTGPGNMNMTNMFYQHPQHQHQQQHLSSLHQPPPMRSVSEPIPRDNYSHRDFFQQFNRSNKPTANRFESVNGMDELGFYTGYSDYPSRSQHTSFSATSTSSSNSSLNFNLPNTSRIHHNNPMSNPLDNNEMLTKHASYGNNNNPNPHAPNFFPRQARPPAHSFPPPSITGFYDQQNSFQIDPHMKSNQNSMMLSQRRGYDYSDSDLMEFGNNNSNTNAANNNTLYHANQNAIQSSSAAATNSEFDEASLRRPNQFQHNNNFSSLTSAANNNNSNLSFQSQATKNIDGAELTAIATAASSDPLSKGFSDLSLTNTSAMNSNMNTNMTPANYPPTSNQNHYAIGSGNSSVLFM